jgi:hypothetical protein
LDAKKWHDFTWFTSKRNSKILKRKQTKNKRNEAKKSKRNEKEPEHRLTKKKSEAKTNWKYCKLKQKNRSETKKNRKIVSVPM